MHTYEKPQIIFGTISLAHWTGTLTMKMQLKPLPIQMGCDVDVYAL